MWARLGTSIGVSWLQPAASVLALLTDTAGVVGAVVVAVEPDRLRVIAVDGGRESTVRLGHVWWLPDPLWTALTETERLALAVSRGRMRHSPIVVDMAASGVVAAALPAFVTPRRRSVGDQALASACRGDARAAVVAAVQHGERFAVVEAAVGQAASALAAMWRLHGEAAASRARLARLTAMSRWSAGGARQTRRVTRSWPDSLSSEFDHRNSA